MEKLEQENFDINTFSDIEDIYQPTDATIQKELVNSITNLSNLLKNGIVYINYGIYENLKHTKGSNYSIPKECKILSDVMHKNSKRDTLRQFRKQYSNSNKSKNNDSVNIVVTVADKEETIEDYFGMDQSMIKPHQDFNFGADSSMLLDQSAIFSNIDMVNDNIANQSMIIMDSNGRSIFSHDDPENYAPTFLNINGLTDFHINPDAEGNNSTLVNVADVDNNYLSTSDNESNNSTACWDDMVPVTRVPGSVNEEYSTDEDDQPLKNEFKQAFAKSKYSYLDVNDIKHGNTKANIQETNMSSSTIQVHQCQVVPNAWNDDNDEISLAKAALKKQRYKNCFPHKKLYPLDETPYLNESNYSFVNSNTDTINSSLNKDDLSITKDIVNKNVKKFNSLGLETEEYFQKSNSSSSNHLNSNVSTLENKDINTLSLEFNSISSTINKNALAPLFSSSDNGEKIPSVNNFVSLQSKFNQSNDNSDEYLINKSNKVWSYKMKKGSKDIIDIDSELHHLDVPMSAVDTTNTTGSIIIPEKLNIKDRIKDIENSILVNDSINEDESSVNDQMDIPNEDNKQTSQNDNNLLEIPQNNNDLPDSSIADITIVKSNEIDDIINVSVGTVKDLVTDIEQDSKLNETDNIETVNQPLFEIGKEKLTTESEKLPINEEDIDDDDTDEEQPLEFLSDHEQQIENETKVLPEMVNEGIHEDVAEKPNEILSNNKESVEIESEIAMHENEEDLEEPIEYIIDNEDEEPIEYINDNENAVKEHTECIDKNEKIDDPSILFNDGTENLINNELIDGNIEDHIIIEEEDSIVGNAIEEALENKSFVIQEHPFMDEPYANDLSFSFD
ncbi:hypothetical protein PIROE2DRAFT_4402, partial [Piromyces sp. E2]